MVDFIEITESVTRTKVLVPTKLILSVSEDEGGGAFIETGVDESGYSSGICTVERYADLKERLTI